MTEWTLSNHHAKAYGRWPTNPQGTPPDPARCCDQVLSYRGLPHQCTRPRGHGPEQAYCKQHSPEAVAARDKAAKERYEKEMADWRLKLAGPRFFAALCKIADGNKNPRETALEAIKGYRKEPGE